MLERLSDANRARWFLLGSVLVTGTLYTIPYGWYVAYPLVLLSTYVHEIAHGLAAALVGGQFDSLVIHADGSGVASTSGNSGRFAFAFVAGAGLVGPAGGGAAFLILASRPKLARVGLGLFALLSAVALIWVVRNIFGWFFVGLLAAGCGGAAWRGTAQIAQAVVAFLGVQLALSVFSRADYLFTEVATTVPHPVPWTHICAMPPGTAHTPRAPRSAFDTQASRDARSGCTAPRSRPRRRGRPRGSERFGRGSLAP